MHRQHWHRDLDGLRCSVKGGSKNPPGVNRRRCCASFIADILFGPPAPLAPEGDEVWFGVHDFAPGYHHECAAVQAHWILSGVQRIEQEFLVARHGVLLEA
jgi:hypothetical protein